MSTSQRDLAIDEETSANMNVALPDAPDIPGLTFRPFRGESDYPHIVAVFNACKELDGFEITMTVEGVARDYANLMNCDPYRDMLFAEVQGAVIAYSRVMWVQESSGEWIYWTLGFLLPAWRRKGIGAAMLRYNEAHLREIARQHPKDAPRYFQRWATAAQVGLEAMLQEEGYTAARHIVEMNRPISAPLPQAPMPEGLEVRPVRPAHYRAIWDAGEEALEGRWGFVPGTEEDYQRWLTSPNFQPELWKIAWDGDQVAGMERNYVREVENEEYNRKRGYTENIRVRPAWRRRGLARALLVQSIQMFRAMGMEETHLQVDTQNLTGALSLYESVGYQVARRHTVYRKAMK